MRTSMRNVEGGDGRDGVLRFLTHARSRSVIIFLAAGLLLGIALLVLGREMNHHVLAIEVWIAQLGPWSVLAFVGLFILTTSCLLPETLPVLLAGALFGFSKGLAVAAPASLLAASLQFYLARHLLRSRIQRKLAARPPLAAIQRAVLRDEFRLQVMLRLTPLNPATISYLLGAAGVRFQGFLIASLGLIPHLLLEVYFGHAGKHIARMAGRKTQAVYIHDVAVIGGLAVILAVVVFVSKAARKTLMEAVSGHSETIERRETQ